jgi:hypothetical protein
VFPGLLSYQEQVRVTQARNRHQLSALGIETQSVGRARAVTFLQAAEDAQRLAVARAHAAVDAAMNPQQQRGSASGDGSDGGSSGAWETASDDASAC